ncbi:MAG: hypothetical protein GEU81_14380 [Nitriliruptorales bacterium]|nr:hypothetical protein [Nitriliruptorales bacterium]
MARVPLLTDDDADEITKAFFEGCIELIGRVPNSMRVYGRMPKVAMWLLPFLVSLQREGAGGRLDGRTKELVVLKTSLTNACDYCATHNTSLGIATGLTMDEINVLDTSYIESNLLSERDKAVVRWAEAVTRNQAARDKEGFEALREWFDDDEIVELTWLSAMFNMLNRVHDSLHLDIEPQDEVDKIQRSSFISQDAVLDYVRRMVDLTTEHRADASGA